MERGPRPFEQDGREVPTEELPFTIAVRESRPVHKRFEFRPDGGPPMEIEASAVPLAGASGCQGAIVIFWPVGDHQTPMQVKLWGVRGSIPVAAPSAGRYGGNTPCVALTLADGSRVVLDAGSGIRVLGETLAGGREPVHVLLSHLHLDHIQGLLFFKPLFDADREITVWGPPAADGSLRDRLARYLSAPLSPIEMRDLPARVSYRTCPPGAWPLGSALVEAALVNHRGPTFGYRISEGAASLCYLPDHEPALGQSLETSEAEQISGYGLAHRASLLIHDGQYTDREYQAHVGWGHSAASDALMFARRVEARRVVLFHHDPAHGDDELDALRDEARARWSDSGEDGQEVEVAVEQDEFEVQRLVGLTLDEPLPTLG